MHEIAAADLGGGQHLVDDLLGRRDVDDVAAVALVRLIPATPPAEAKRSIFGAACDSILYLAPDEELFSTGARWRASH